MCLYSTLSQIPQETWILKNIRLTIKSESEWTSLAKLICEKEKKKKNKELDSCISAPSVR